MSRTLSRGKSVGCLIVMMWAAAVASSAEVPLQPFATNVRQAEAVMSSLGQPIAAEDETRIAELLDRVPEQTGTVAALEQILAPYTIAVVVINSEGRVSVQTGDAKPKLVQTGTAIFLVKVINDAGVTAPLTVTSPNSGKVYTAGFETAYHPPGPGVTAAEARERWADISLYESAPFARALSGLQLEYRLLLVGSRDAGQRSAKFRFEAGAGSRDLGYRNQTTILFSIAKAHRITLGVRDEKNLPTTASFLFRDAYGRIYPNPAKRLAPDFFFQPQVYRADGESIYLPVGTFTVTVTGGPEYLAETRHFTIGEGAGDSRLEFHLKRWIDPSASRMVFRRSSHSRRGMLALRASDRRRGSEGHGSPGAGRTFECGERSQLGARLLSPEAIFPERRG